MRDVENNLHATAHSKRECKGVHVFALRLDKYILYILVSKAYLLFFSRVSICIYEYKRVYIYIYMINFG